MRSVPVISGRVVARRGSVPRVDGKTRPACDETRLFGARLEDAVHELTRVDVHLDLFEFLHATGDVFGVATERLLALLLGRA